MELFTMRCPNCNADLEVENGIDSFFCKYCGTKILVTGQSKEVIKTKRRLKMMDKAHEMQQEYINEQRRREKEAQRKEEEELELMRLGMPITIALIVVIACIIGFIVWSGNHSIDKENQRLDVMYSEIQADIAQGDYDSALLKANNLRFMKNDYASERRWNETREQLIEMIQDLRDDG